MLESLTFLYTQVLTGDTVDGYKGCPKIGKVKAAKILAGAENEARLLMACHKAYFKVYGEEAKEKLLEQIGQARILHRQDAMMLMQYDVVYNPYDVLGVEDEVCRMWEQV